MVPAEPVTTESAVSRRWNVYEARQRNELERLNRERLGEAARVAWHGLSDTEKDAIRRLVRERCPAMERRDERSPLFLAACVKVMGELFRR